MNRDELEFSISQYHDGALPPLETRAIEELLGTSAQAREVLAEYQRLDALVKSARAVPPLDWDRVHAHLSQAVAQVPDEEAPAARTYLIGRSWTRYVGVAAAIAAAITIVAVVMFRGDHVATNQTLASNPLSIQIGPPPPGASTAIVQNDLTGISAPAGNGTAQAATDVRVGPSPQVAGMAWGYDDGILQRPARVIIAGDTPPAQDGGSPIPD